MQTPSYYTNRSQNLQKIFISFRNNTFSAKQLVTLSANCTFMRKVYHLFIILSVLLTCVGCKDKASIKRISHLGDTPYQQDSILVVYATNPKRALRLLDSALLLGNISDYRGQFIRAKIYSKSLMEGCREDFGVMSL